MKRYLKIQFSNSSSVYTYEFPSNMKISEGQYVTVDTPREGIKAVKVIEIFPKGYEPSKSINYKMIHGVVKAIQSKEVKKTPKPSNAYLDEMM